MKPLKTLIELLTPDTCIGCGNEGLSVCDDCAQSMYFHSNCFVCKRPSVGGLTCDRCRSKTPISQLIVGAIYKDLAKDLVAKMKYGPSASTARRLAELVVLKIPYLEPDETIVTYIPTTTDRVRERGFDQSKVIAQHVSHITSLRFAPALRRLTKSHQVGSTKKEREEHMRDAFDSRNTFLLSGKTVVLVDDVLTTGATLESASKVLKKARAKKIVAVVFARAE